MVVAFTHPHTYPSANSSVEYQSVATPRRRLAFRFRECASHARFDWSLRAEFRCQRFLESAQRVGNKRNTHRSPTGFGLVCAGATKCVYIGDTSGCGQHQRSKSSTYTPGIVALRIKTRPRFRRNRGRAHDTVAALRARQLPKDDQSIDIFQNARSISRTVSDAIVLNGR